MGISKRFLTNGLYLMVLAAFVFGMADALIKYLSSAFSAVQIGFVRFFLGLLVIGPILFSRRISIRGQNTKVLILRGLFGTASFFCLLKSFALVPLSDAIVLFYTFPIFVILFSYLLFRVTIEKGELVLVGLGLLGIYLLTNPDFSTFHKGYAFGLLSSCLGGMAAVLVHRARQTNGPLIIYFYFCVTGGLLCFPSFIQTFRIPSLGDGIMLLLLAVLLLIAQVTMNHAFKFCGASEGSLIMMSEVVFAGMAGFLIFKDPFTTNFAVGALLIVGSGVGLNLLSRRARHAPVLSQGKKE